MSIKNMPSFGDIETEDTSKKPKNNLNLNMFDNNIDEDSLMQFFGNLSEDQTKSLSETAENIFNKLSKNNIDIDSMMSGSLDINTFKNFLNSFTQDEIDAISNIGKMIMPNSEDTPSLLDGYTNNESLAELFEDDETEKDTDNKNNNEKISLTSEKFNTILKRADEQYSILCKRFTRERLEEVFPDFEDAEYKQSIPVSIFKDYLPDNIINSYDIIKILNESIHSENKTLSFLAESTNMMEKPYSPLCFTLYYDGSEFHTYIYKELNPLDENNELIKIDQLFSDQALSVLTQNAEIISEDMYTNLLAMLSENDLINDAYYADNIFIDTTRHPLETISNLGEYKSIPTEYYKDGLFYIGYIKLNNEMGAKFFVEDFNLTPKDNTLKVYAAFSSSQKLSSVRVENILSKFNSAFIENNDLFKNHVSIEPYKEDSVIIRFYNI